MPVVHEYVDQAGFYVLAVPYGLSSPVTYQVRDGAVNLFAEMALSDGDRVSWSFLRPLIAIDQIHTQQSGVASSDEVADALSDLSEKERADAMEYFTQYFELSDSELEELRAFASGSVQQLSPELREKLDSQLNGDLSDSSAEEIDTQFKSLNSPVGNETELKKYIIELLDLSEDEIGKLEYLLSGDLVQLTPGFGSELGDRLIQAEEMSVKDARNAKLAELVTSLLMDEFDEQDVVKLSLRGQPGSFGETGQANYEYYGGSHRLFNLSSDQAQSAKRMLKERGAASIEEEEYTNGIWITFTLVENASHHNVDAEVDNIIRTLEHVHNAELTDINRAHLTSLRGSLASDDTDFILKPGWDDRNLNL